jgi:hypothetical protein
VYFWYFLRKPTKLLSSIPNNYRNETINLPPYEIMPPVLEGYDSHEPAGNFYTITGEWIPL